MIETVKSCSDSDMYNDETAEDMYNAETAEEGLRQVIQPGTRKCPRFSSESIYAGNFVS